MQLPRRPKLTARPILGYRQARVATSACTSSRYITRAFFMSISPHRRLVGIKSLDEMLSKLYKSLADLAGLEDCRISNQHYSQPVQPSRPLQKLGTDTLRDAPALQELRFPSTSNPTEKSHPKRRGMPMANEAQPRQGRIDGDLCIRYPIRYKRFYLLISLQFAGKRNILKGTGGIAHPGRLAKVSRGRPVGFLQAVDRDVYCRHRNIAQSLRRRCVHRSACKRRLSWAALLGRKRVGF